MERDSGGTPETPPGARPLDPASKKPILDVEAETFKLVPYIPRSRY